MPIRRKVLLIGNSRGITLPKGWLESFEEKTGRPVKEVNLEVDGVLKVEPVCKGAKTGE
jgi:antitoxin component of MazEF toxin-antitoxin module